MLIRRAALSDMEGLNDLLLQVLMVQHNGRPDLFKPHAKKYTDDELAAFCTEDYVFYGRLLGFRHQSKGLFHQIKQHTSIPLLSKLAKASHSLTETGMTMLEQDVRAAHIYESVVSSQYSRPFFHEYSRQLVILS